MPRFDHLALSVEPRIPRGDPRLVGGERMGSVPSHSAVVSAGLAAIRRLGGGIRGRDQMRTVGGSPKWGSMLGSAKLVMAEIRSPSMVRTSRPTACAIGACSSLR